LKKGTKTSSFGSPGRESHDSSIFYSRSLYKEKFFLSLLLRISLKILFRPNFLMKLFLGTHVKSLKSYRIIVLI